MTSWQISYWNSATMGNGHFMDIFGVGGGSMGKWVGEDSVATVRQYTGKRKYDRWGKKNDCHLVFVPF